MLTLALYGLLAVILAGALFLAAAYLLPAGEQIAPPIRDEPLWDLPAGQRLDPGEVAVVRLPVALRGYRFAETDLLLDRLVEELRERDDEIARLRERSDAYGSYDPSAYAAPKHGSSDEDAETWQPQRNAADDEEPREASRTTTDDDGPE